MKTRFAALVTGLLIAGSIAEPMAQAPPSPTAQTAARSEALRRAQQATQVSRMPNLVGQPFQAAQQDQRVTALKLQLIGRAQQNSDYKPGTIISHEPPPNALVKPGTSVTVFVAVAEAQTPNTGRGSVATVDVPRLVGMEIRAGGALLSKLSLGAQTQFVETTRFAPGTIVDQKPEPGTRVRLPYTVLIVVARHRPELPQRPDPPPFTNPQPLKLYQMPDLVGRTLPIAERDPQVRELRLQLTLQYDTTAAGLPNTIVRQSVPAGTGVEIGRAVTVFVASGVSVPPVVRQQADVAEQRIVAVGLHAKRMQEISTQPPGTVLRQVPEAGTLVARGAAVGITVAVPPRVVIPELVGRARGDAMQELARLQLRGSPVNDEASLLPPEQVVSQVPGAGTEVVVGAAVRIAVATGVQVPNLSGLTAQDAQRAVTLLGLSFADVGVETDAAPPDRVFEQQPSPGTAVARGSTVRVTIALPVLVTVPNLIGMSRTRAVAAVETAGLRVGGALDGVAADRLVQRQLPAANSRVGRQSAITLFFVPQAPPPGPAPAPVSPQTPQPTLPNPAQGPVVPVAPTPVAPVAPLLPPWLLSLIVVLASVAISTVRLWWPQRATPPPVHTAAPAMPPPPAIAVHAGRGDSTQRLEVFGRSLITFDVRVRVDHGRAEQSLDAAGERLVIEDRRLYE